VRKREEALTKKKASRLEALAVLAERGGFEPPIGYEPIHAFQACDLNHSSISPECGFAFTKPHIIAKVEGVVEETLVCD
jgi:hypothetical protein